MQRMEALEWVSIKMKNGNFLFLSSELAVSFLCQRFSIDNGNVADMRSIPEEMMMDGRNELRKFTDILDGIQDLNNNIIIHCRMGLNRTPVTAAIFLVEKMNYHPSEVKCAVEGALRKRKPDYMLNELGLYCLPLQEAEKRYMARNAPMLHKKSRQHAREVDEITRQKQMWYGC